MRDYHLVIPAKPKGYDWQPGPTGPRPHPCRILFEVEPEMTAEEAARAEAFKQERRERYNRNRAIRRRIESETWGVA